MKITQDVLKVLSALTFDGNRAMIEAQLDRKQYEAVNKVLVACGGKWNRSAKAHVFPDSASERIDVVLLAGEVTTAKDTGFFPTPEGLAKELVELADVRAGHTVLEPSAGTGRIVDALCPILRASGQIYVVERNDKMLRELAARRNKSGSGLDFVIVATPDFMEVDAKAFANQFDRVVMNPPFAKVGLGDHLDHVQHAFKMLKSGGVLVSVLPNGVIFREDKRHRAFRTWAEEQGGEFAKLPSGSFKESGTGVETCTLRIEKS